jgi:hypothetical protein
VAINQSRYQIKLHWTAIGRLQVQGSKEFVRFYVWRLLKASVRLTTRAGRRPDFGDLLIYFGELKRLA